MSYGLPLYKVNMATLGLFVEYPFFKTTCVNLNVDIAVRFHSHHTFKGMFGEGWQFSYDSKLFVDKNQNKIFVKKPSGQTIAFNALPKTDFSNGASVECTPLMKCDGRLIEYDSYYYFEDRKKGQFYQYTKDSDGSTGVLSYVTDYCGNAIQFIYGDNGFVRKIIDVFGRIIEFSYSSKTYCTGISLPDGREASISYDLHNRIEKIINFAGVPVCFTYDDNAQIETMTVGKKQKTTRFTYTKQQTQSLIKKITDRNGNATSYEMLSSQPVTVQVTSPSGKIKKHISINGLTRQIADEDGRTIFMEYMNGRRISVTDKNGNRQQMEYDEKDNLICKTDGAGNKEFFKYDEGGNLIERTDGLGRTTKFTFDERRNIIGIESAEGYKTVLSYDEGGRLSEKKLPNGNIQKYEYDAFSNLINAKDMYGHLYRAAYDKYGYQRLECIDAKGNRTVNKMDEMDRIREIDFPDGTSKTFEYDCCAGILTHDELGGTWINERDPMSNIVKKIDPTGYVKGFQYNKEGRLTKEIDGFGNNREIEYDVNGYVLKSINELGGTVCYKRDANGNMIQASDENQNKFSFEYNKNNQVRKVTDPLGKTTVYGYDAANNVSFTITPRKHKISYAFSKDNLIERKLVDDKPVAIFSHNAIGDITSITEGTKKTEFEYDMRGRNTSVYYCENKQASMVYDEDDRLVSMKYPNGLQVNYSYDVMGRVEDIRWGEHQINRSYDAAGRVIAEQRTNATESLFAYDSCHRPVKIEHKKSGNALQSPQQSQQSQTSTKGPAYACLQYRYDELGNLIEEDRHIPVLDEIQCEIAQEAFVMDYNSVNQTVRRNGTVFAYDDDGNMTAMAGDSPVSFQYDEENRLIGKKDAKISTFYEYNVLNQLIKIKRNDKTLLRYFDLEGKVIFESEEGGNDRCHIYCEGILAATVQSDGSALFYHYDSRYNTALITNENGDTICAYSYLPYGGILKKSEVISYNPFTFLGAYGVIDEKDGFYLTANRCYNSMTGSFLQQDPLGFVDGQNLYTYARGNPMTRIDPEGSIIWFVPVAIAVGIYGSVKAYQSFNNVSKKAIKYNEKLKKLDIARKRLESYSKALAAGRIDTNLYWKAKDAYDKAVIEASNEAANTAKVGVYEYGLPGGLMGEAIKDISCTSP